MIAITRRTLGLAAALAALSFLPAYAQDASKSSAKGSLDAADRKFVEKAAAGGLAEVEMGRLANTKGMNQGVKDFGARMVQDHGRANEELKTLAANKGVTLPTGPDKSHQKKMDKMNKVAAEKFDPEYMEDMVKDHKEDVKDFEKQAKNAKDADVRAFAAKTLPVLQEHLKLAEQTRDAVKSAKKK